MRLLIAGWQGQIARALVEAAPGRPDVTACAVGRPALDICEVKTIERALAENRPDVVINTAGYTAVDDAETEQERAQALNGDGPRLLAEAARQRGAAIIHLSTDYVFDGTKPTAYAEADPVRPATVYGRSKLAGELAVAGANPRHVILRTSWVFSPFGNNFVTSILAKAKTGAATRLVADQTGNPTYAPDLAEAILDIAARIAGLGVTDEIWGTYHIANSGHATWLDIGRHVLASAHPERAGDVEAIASADYPTRTPRPRNATLDCSKLEAAFGIKLRPWREALDDCLARLSRPS